jgi:DNA-binding LytR/AlgR family response regulator
MNVVIIEDESLAANRLEELILELKPGTNILAKLESVKDSVKWLQENKPDLVFLDIQLSDGISFSIFQQIQIDTPIIFTTAFEEYAIKAFKLNSIDYLLKPIRKSDLAKSLDKYENLKKPVIPDFQELVNLIKSRQPEYKERFIVRLGQQLHKIEVKEIAFFYAMEKCVFFKTFSNDTFTIDQTLSNLEEFLDPGMFFRINRTVFTNINAIKKIHLYSRARIKLNLSPSPPKEIKTLVSIEKTSDFKKWLDK